MCSFDGARVSLLVVPLLAACVGVRAGDPSVRADAALTSEVAERLSTDAIARACPSCVSDTVFVRDQLLESDTSSGEEARMSPEIRASISDSYPGVAFIDRDREPGLLGGDGSPPSGATIVYVGLLRWLAPDVLEVEVGTVAASNGYKSAWFQYEKVNGIRIPAIGDDTGTPLTTAVS